MQKFYRISGMENGRRVDSRVLEERIQEAVAAGHRYIEVEAYGQHGIGGRLWKAGNEKVYIRIYGSPGQRVGAMGFPNTTIEVMGPASDDTGWLNAGAEIIVHGHATNGTANAMAQGKIYIAGNIGARGMTMTKHNPRFAPPELWVLGSVGDYFAEFMAGGIAVVCGYKPQDPENVLGYRPCVGMVGGKIFFRGAQKAFSQADAKLTAITDEEWRWLVENLAVFLEKINRPELFEELTDRNQWHLLVARSPQEKRVKPRRPMRDFRLHVWEKELGRGGLFGDLIEPEAVPIPLITTGELRRFVPVWENSKYLAPCQAGCPIGIPVHQEWRLVREGRLTEAVSLALRFTPFPASVCGHLCPNFCMQGCTRNIARMAPPDTRLLGRASLKAELPEVPPLTGKKVAIIGGGPAGISAAWQLRLQGHYPVIYEQDKHLGGKLFSVIPRRRIPEDILSAEFARIESLLPEIILGHRVSQEDVLRMKTEYDFIVVAVGAQKPRMLNVEGKERAIPALHFLRQAKENCAQVGKRVVIIGAGNVGCDVAAEAHRLGAEDITLIHYRRPPASGEEKKAAEAAGARFLWPRSVKAITAAGVELSTGEFLPADMVVMATGHEPVLDFLPETVRTKNGFIEVNDFFQTTDPQIFAIGDAVKMGFLAHAIGAGRKAAVAISRLAAGKSPSDETQPVIDYARIKLEYFDPRPVYCAEIEKSAAQCVSCGTCRDCGICVAICPEGAISRETTADGGFAMVVDHSRCIGCGFCAGACPCGVWRLVENEPLD